MTWAPPVLDAERELREHLSPDEWREPVALVLARHGLDSGDLAPYPTGSDVVWRAGENVVKLTTPEWNWQIEAEVRSLDFVAGGLRVEVPRVVARGELAGWPYVVLTRVPGVALGDVWGELDARDRLRLAADLGGLTRDLHALDVDAEPERWAGFRAECLTRAAERDARALPDGPEHDLALQVPAYLERHAEALHRADHAFLHTELLDQHVFVRERGGRHELSALIDFADARVGPREYDVPALVEFVFRGEPGLLGAFLRAYGETPDEDASERLLAWGLAHRYGSLARQLRTVGDPVPRSLTELARRLYVL